MEKIALFWGHNSIRTFLGSLSGNISFLRPTDTGSIRPKLPLELNSPFPIPNSQFSKRGFTLIELITAIGVLAILTSVLLAVVNPLEQFNKSEDTRRKADLAQIQRALEIYYQDHGQYPAMSSGQQTPNRICKEAGTCLTIVNWGDDFRPYMDVLPIDPNGSKNYAYWTDPSGQSYAIYASLTRGSKDPQVCNNGAACTGSAGISCGGVCNYGVTSPNIAP